MRASACGSITRNVVFSKTRLNTRFGLFGWLDSCLGGYLDDWMYIDIVGWLVCMVAVVVVWMVGWL